MPYVIRNKVSHHYLDDPGNWTAELRHAYIYTSLHKAAEECMFDNEEIVEVSFVPIRDVPREEALKSLD